MLESDRCARQSCLRDLFSIPDAGIKTLRDDVRQAIVAYDLDFNVWILSQQLRELRQEDGVAGIFW